MPSNLHNSLTNFCKQTFPTFLTHEEQWHRTFRHIPKSKICPKPLPDLLSPDNKIAIECTVFSKDALERLYEYSEVFQELLLVMPNLRNVKEIWMYDPANNELRKFHAKATPVK